MQKIFDITDMHLVGKYHELYQNFGMKKGANGNFHCHNSNLHSHNDSNPSVSINKENGKFFCHRNGCNWKGNFQSYWKEELKGTRQGGDSWVYFVSNILKVPGIDKILTNENNLRNLTDKEIEDIDAVYNNAKIEFENEYGINIDEYRELNYGSDSFVDIPLCVIDEYSNNLLQNTDMMDYLKKTRNINEKDIIKNKIGLLSFTAKKNHPVNIFIFPIIDINGKLINLKKYNPFDDVLYKWSYEYPNNGICPTGLNNLGSDTLIFLEGEPDYYCAYSYVNNNEIKDPLCKLFEGVITLGSNSNCNVEKSFGTDICEMYLEGKNIIICFDSDESTKDKKSSEKLADSILRFNPKQIKIIDLNKNDENPYGLDPDATKEVRKARNIKLVRSEKDFTDFMRKNGFKEDAVKRFFELVDNTDAYSCSSQLYKVSVQESRLPRYYSNDGSTRIEVIASISGFDGEAYLFGNKFLISCPCMGGKVKKKKDCSKCILPLSSKFKNHSEIEFEFIVNTRNYPSSKTVEKILITPNDALGMIQRTHQETEKLQRKLFKINPMCKLCTIKTNSVIKLIHSSLARDVSRYSEDVSNNGSIDVAVDAYIISDDVSVGKIYKLIGVQTMSYDNQKAVLFIDEIEYMSTPIDKFSMNKDIAKTLLLFRRNESESIGDCLKRRYKVFADNCGATDRREFFEIMDSVFFSVTELKFPSIMTKRGWIEVIIIGETRTCKTEIAIYLFNKYRDGEMITCTDSTKRSGILGGIDTYGKRPKVCWGTIPLNDNSTVIMDEIQKLDVSILNSMTPSRSNGVVSVDGIAKGKADGRTRKIMIGNPRGNDSTKKDLFGVDAMMDVCIEKQIFARFDVAFFAKTLDVPVLKICRPQLDKFTDHQCRLLLMWARSRKVSEIIYEDGFDIRLDEIQNVALKKYHPECIVVNQEFKAKLLRMSISVAGRLFSTYGDDYNKLYVTVEHLDYAYSFLDYLYTHKNMRIDKYSEKLRSDESLGNMDFFRNIAKYIDISLLIDEKRFVKDQLSYIFFDYLHKVHMGKMYMVDAINDEIKETRVILAVSLSKLIGTLMSRKCLAFEKGRYRKTEQFNDFLIQLKSESKDGYTDILEVVSDELDDKEPEKLIKFNRSFKSIQVKKTDDD
jgi:hypothetical protein